MSSKDVSLQIGERIKQHRKAKGLTQEQLASISEVKYTTLTKIESGVIKSPSMDIMSKLALALDASLDDFLMVETLRGEQGLQALYKDVLSTLSSGQTMYISGIDEKMFLDTNQDAVQKFISDLKEKKINQKLISCEGDTFTFEQDHLKYRWIPKKFFNPTPIYTYADRVASIIWGPPQQIVILKNKHLADAYKKQFLFMWEKAKPFS